MSFILVVIAIFVGLVWHKAWQFRRVSRIAVHPPVGEMALSELPVKLRRFLTEVELHLIQLGFLPFGNVRTIRLSEWLAWTGMFFFNRESGERASVLSWGPPRRGQLGLGWVTEFSDGQRITTQWLRPEPAAALGAGNSVLGTAETSIVDDVCAWHRRRVEQAIVERKSVGMETLPGRALPSPEDGPRWLRAQADRMAERLAFGLNYRVGVFGRCYEPTWAECVRRALGGSPAASRPASYGFEVILSPRAATPLEPGAAADSRSDDTNRG